MRSLGYPRIISVENFRNPNFELVADCLDWLVQRFDESADIDDDISTETDRVTFLKNVSKVFMSRARLKLNVKRLYAADGYARPRRPPSSNHPPPTLATHFQITERQGTRAHLTHRPIRPDRLAVKELLKIANLLYQATKNADEDDATDPDATDAFELDAEAFDVKLVRRLASEITQRGAAIYDALGDEKRLRVERARAVGRDVDLDEIEAQVQEQIASVRDNVQGLERTLGDLRRDEESLESKIEKRRAELERAEKRLSALRQVRPAYMDEYDQLEAGMDEMYDAYVEKRRNLDYLEWQLREMSADEDAAREEKERELRDMQRRMRNEEMKILRGEGNVGGDDEDFDVHDEPARARPGAAQRRSPPKGPVAKRFGLEGARVAAGSRAGGTGAGLGGRREPAVTGSMTGGDLSGDSSEGELFEEDDSSGSDNDF